MLAQLTPAELAAVQAALAKSRKSDVDAKRDRMIKTARKDLIGYAKFTMPDLKNRADTLATRYKPSKHHLALGAAFHKVDSGEWPLLIITMPPRHGKSELASKRGVAWFLGRDPYRQVIFATYNETVAGDTGRALREILNSDEHKAVFPDCSLARGSQSADRLMTTWGGGIVCVGRGGAVTSRGGDLVVVDDPIKGRKEADSAAVRKEAWEWFQDDIYSRLLDEGGRVVIIMTRWHEDDIVGRLTDPANPHYVEEEARKWRILELPALARENDPLGRAVGEALWPARFSAKYLEGFRARNPRGFASLYQCSPSPEDGDFFRAAWLTTYRQGEMPTDLKWFGASDHAVATKQSNDRTCLGVGGVDSNGVLWIPPDIEWGRFEPDVTVERWVALIKRRRPLTWWAEAEHISKSLGPFLRKKMREEKAYCTIEPVTGAKDKSTKAQSFRGMCSLGMVRFPEFAPWWQDAKAELLKFPNATHDDFVDFCSHLGAGIDRMFGTTKKKEEIAEPTERRTFAWLKRLATSQKDAAAPARGGW